MRKSSARPRQFLNRRGALFLTGFIMFAVLFRILSHVTYRTMRLSEMRGGRPVDFRKMVVLSNSHPFPDSPSILEESHELKCVSVSNRTEGIRLLYSGFGIGESLHNIEKNDLLIFNFDKDDNLVGVIDKNGNRVSSIWTTDTLEAPCGKGPVGLFCN